MQRGYIAVMDSGIGGLSVLSELVKNFPRERFLYYGDNGNAPYGNKNKRQLLRIAVENLNYLKGFGVKAIVLACNTLSVNFISCIIEYAQVPVFGIFPPVEICLTRNEKTLLLCTERTAENYKNINGLDVVGLPTLVNFIENNALNLSAFNAVNEIYRNHNGYFCSLSGYYDNVILGCTHYNFIKKQIIDHFCPQKIYSGVELTINMLSKFILNEKSLVKIKRFPVLFVGEYAKFNEKVFNTSGQSG